MDINILLFNNFEPSTPSEPTNPINSNTPYTPKKTDNSSNKNIINNNIVESVLPHTSAETTVVIAAIVAVLSATIGGIIFKKRNR
ncbi:LPXTG cell wall anchor domain-containing protein [Leuconostoc falkenbergense]|uniref:LPXTG cell wall anchor domain-containing protein n=1 Tax=Leuconostoc falkenbergense TaxID=2766470 RepID=UPI0024ACF5DC|nr:LPXTG cell wall anchor domain-containing protein [Leuconostoc falkenbergense]MDI6668136.1 LPXTG cell wall anchor domain-containing protein [Leuconostoc falkenbergense]